MTTEITALEIRDVLRLKHIKFEPRADALLIVIGGDNAQGKTSLQRSIVMALGGAAQIPSDPVRHGALDGDILLKLNDDVTVYRRILHDGQSKLEVTSKYGPIKSPQEWLTKLFGGRALNPLDFLRRKATEQRELLLKLIDKDGKIAGIESNRAAVFKRRTEVGRDLDKARAQLAGAAEVTPGAPVDVAELAKESNAISERARDQMAAGGKLRDAQLAADRAQNDVKRVDTEIDRLRVALSNAEENRDRLATVAAEAEVEAKNAEIDVRRLESEWESQLKPRRDEIQKAIAEATEHNRKVAADQAAAAQRVKLAAEVADLAGDHAALDEEIEKYKAEKMAILQSTKLPAPGLGVNDTEMTLNGIPFAQASSAEKWRVAVCLAISAKPELRDVWIEDGALLDEHALLGLETIARETGYRFWVERVGNKDPGALIIHDGVVVEQGASVTSQLTLGGVS